MNCVCMCIVSVADVPYFICLMWRKGITHSYKIYKWAYHVLRICFFFLYCPLCITFVQMLYPYAEKKRYFAYKLHMYLHIFSYNFTEGYLANMTLLFGHKTPFFTRRRLNFLKTGSGEIHR